MENRDNFYAWRNVAAGMFLMAMVYGIVNNCFSIYMIPVTEDLGISRQAFSFCQTIIFLGCMTVTPLIGRLTETVRILTIMRGASLVLGAAYLSYGFFSHIVWFYFLSVFVGAGQGFLTMVPLSIIVDEWFDTNRGFAVGVICTGSGIGGMIFNPAANYIIEEWGWRAGFVILGFGILVLSSVMVFFVIKEKTDSRNTGTEEYMGLPEPLPDKPPEKFKDQEGEGCGESCREIIRSGRFCSFFVLLLFSSLSAYTLVNYISPYLQDTGYSSYAAAMAVSVGMGVMAAGKVCLGVMFDRLGSVKTVILAVLGTAAGLLALTGAGNPAMLPGVYLGIFLGCPLGTVAPSVLTGSLFDRRNYGKILGISAAAVNLGTALSPVIANAVYEKTGSYVTAYRMMFSLSLLCLPLCAVLFRKCGPERGSSTNHQERMG